MRHIILLTLLLLPLAAFAAPPDTPTPDTSAGFDKREFTTPDFDAASLVFEVAPHEVCAVADPVDGFIVPTGKGFTIHRPGIDQNGQRRDVACVHPPVYHRCRDAL